MVYGILSDATLAGIGALLAGLGSAFTGWAALRAARREKEPAQEGEKHEDAKA
jgi:hypothetical protein